LILGSVDVLDLLSFVVSPMKYTDYVDLAVVRQRMREPAFSAIDASRVNPFLPVMDSMTLEDIIVTLFANGVHRVPVIDEDDIIQGICSQSDAIDFIQQNIKSDVPLCALVNLKNFCRNRF
jgi:CBS-domain-containing membrane protein